MPLLNAPFALREIRDAEAFVWSIVQRSKLDLTWHEREDLAAYLLAEAWKLSERYEEPSTISFSTWAGTTLRLRVIDWQRATRGRTRWQFDGYTYERAAVELVPLDTEHDRVGAALSPGAGDPAHDRDPDLERLLGTGDSTLARDLDTLGLQPARRVA